MAFSEALADRDDGVLAIHNNFKKSGSPGAQKLGEVPSDLAERSERFLIHQHMLTEGIDDPACTMLVMYTAFTNERQLVQQVGRLTRHPGPLGQMAPPALVFGRPEDRVLSMWDRFLAYDQACVDNGGRPPLQDQEFVNRLEALPDLDYVEGRFRRRADTTDDAIQAEIRVPLSAVIFETGPNFDLDEFADAISDALFEEDRIEQASGPTHDDPSCRYHLSVSLTQTPLLAESLFQTATLDITAYVHRGERLFSRTPRALDRRIRGDQGSVGPAMTSWHASPSLESYYRRHFAQYRPGPHCAPRQILSARPRLRALVFV